MTAAPDAVARLLLLAVCAQAAHPHGLEPTRLSVYDFLTDHPLLLAHRRADPDREALELAGFDDRALAYAGAPHRFALAQAQLPGTLTWLVAYGLLECDTTGAIRYRPTTAGIAVAEQFTSVKSVAYRCAAGIVVRRLRRHGSRRLYSELRATWPR